MKNSALLIFMICYSSCVQNNKKAENDKANPNTTDTSAVSAEITSNGFLPNDTTISFDIEGLSSESSEVKAHYIKGEINDAVWSIFGETGKAVIEYLFQSDGKVKVSEKSYTYKSNFTEVKSDNDIHLKSSSQYVLDTSGVLLSKNVQPEFADLFADLKKNVPLHLSGLK